MDFIRIVWRRFEVWAPPFLATFLVFAREELLIVVVLNGKLWLGLTAFLAVAFVGMNRSDACSVDIRTLENFLARFAKTCRLSEEIF